MAVTKPTLRSVARSLAVDLATAEVVTALRERGIRSVVLRGPALARRVYPMGELRPYVDVDLLVAPADDGAAGDVLSRLGFAVVVSDEELEGHRPAHAHEWVRERDTVAVDLHRTLSGAGARPDQVWAVIAEGAETEVVGGAAVEVPSLAAVALQLGLHAAHHGPRRGKSLRDLELALERLPEGAWLAAAELASQLDAVPAFAAGLRLVPAGALLAERLGLPFARPVDIALRASSAPPLALGLDWLMRTSGLRAKGVLVVRTLAPSPGALRSWRPLARRRPLGLAAAYLSHPFWLARHVVPSLMAVRHAQKEAL
jgi:hypothetical protein